MLCPFHRRIARACIVVSLKRQIRVAQPAQLKAQMCRHFIPIADVPLYGRAQQRLDRYAGASESEVDGGINKFGSSDVYSTISSTITSPAA